MHAIYLSLKNNLGGEVLQIAGGRRITINDLVELISALVNKNIEIIHINERKGEIRKNYSDITKAKKFLSFQPNVELREGITKTINWFWNI